MPSHRAFKSKGFNVTLYCNNIASNRLHMRKGNHLRINRILSIILAALLVTATFPVLTGFSYAVSSSSVKIGHAVHGETGNLKGNKAGDYKGREIYELLQNAEDAKAETVEIILDTRENLLSISNMGDECLSFTEEGFSSIMMAGTSPKQLSKQSYIGNKGLGFRSILNWSDVIRIHSSGVCC